MCPIQPRMHQGMPAAYTACLHTEVLSNETRAAAYEDVHHDRDDGIFKQEYLFVGSGFFSRRKRTWYRLFSTKLYSLESPKAAADPSCEMVKVSCDTCVVSFLLLFTHCVCVPGRASTGYDGRYCKQHGVRKVPHVLILATADRLELQAVACLRLSASCRSGSP